MKLKTRNLQVYKRCRRVNRIRDVPVKVIAAKISAARRIAQINPPSQEKQEIHSKQRLCTKNEAYNLVRFGGSP